MTRGRCAKLVGGCAMLFASALFCSGTSDSASVTPNPRPVQAQHSTDVQGVRVAPLERDAIAQEMRTMLRSLSLILQGLAVGDLDKEALFYLRARGLGEADARRVLIDAFVGELVGAIESDALRPYFRCALDRWLHQGSGK